MDKIEIAILKEELKATRNARVAGTVSCRLWNTLKSLIDKLERTSEMEDYCKCDPPGSGEEYCTNDCFVDAYQRQQKLLSAIREKCEELIVIKSKSLNGWDETRGDLAQEFLDMLKEE